MDLKNTGFAECEINNELIFVSQQDLLTRHKALVAEFLEQNYDAVKSYFFHK